MAMLSVVVPVYNVEKYLKQCIESILNQTYKDFELILVNDGSKDSSGEICDFYKEQDSRVKVIHKVNEGLVNARKTGIQNAVGEYITYVDSDDWIDENMYEVMMHEMIKEDADMITCAIKKENIDSCDLLKNAVDSGVYEGDSLKYLIDNALFSEEYGRNGLFAAVWNKIYKRNVLIENQMRVDGSLRMGEDAMCTFPLLLDCSKVVVMNDFAPYHYRQMEITMSVAYDANFFERACVLLSDLKDVFSEKESETMLRQLQVYNLVIIEMGIKQEFSLKKLNTLKAIKKYKELHEIRKIGEYMSMEAIDKLSGWSRRIVKAFYEKKYFLVTVYILMERVKVLVKQ